VKKATDLVGDFKKIYPEAEKPRAFFAPGRVNLIGEHTDYTGGFVMPFALDLGITMLISPREDGLYYLKSLDYDNQVVFDNNLVFNPDDSWGNYPKGIVLELQKKGLHLKGANIMYASDLPSGAGLSSSAAIGMVTALALTTLNNLQIDLKELAFLCQRMENDFIGVKSGIMDQFAVGLSKKARVLFLDCQNTIYEHVPLFLNDMCIVITNSGKKRGLKESRYNERRQECEEALEMLKIVRPDLKSYRDLKATDLPLINSSLKYPFRERAKHIITENNRVLEAKKALNAGDITCLGQLMLASHRSLSVDYEVTGEELDHLFWAQLNAGCFATRMTGAGFGGCTISLVKRAESEAFCESVHTTYMEKTGLIPEFYITESADGVAELTLN